ncbi:MAG: ferrous iron transport protein A [Candidatus Methanomethylicota archaeon]|uniref:Ferrous iron transport protein A n=1 Tax=Thermoproteota archaeon TaxID=2056631 RepID=A0A497F1T9_9CREN|nr:MAG: ferrous iron transport protein A [Candidatus Verstraetearchaeota archaeon]
MNIRPLSMLQPGEVGIVVQIAAGRGLTRRLVEMGITPGTHVKVLYNGPGPVVIMVRDSRLVLGRGAAMKILVEVDGVDI